MGMVFSKLKVLVQYNVGNLDLGKIFVACHRWFYIQIMLNYLRVSCFSRDAIKYHFKKQF